MYRFNLSIQISVVSIYLLEEKIHKKKFHSTLSLLNYLIIKNLSVNFCYYNYI